MEDSDFGYRFLLVAFVLLLNGFFAAAEVSLVSVRQSRLKQLAAEGDTGAKAALSLLSNPERLLSVVQVGVTLASLGLGWAGEPAMFAVFKALFGSFVTPATEGIFRGATFAAAFVLMTYAHVVIGEVVPKNLAIEKADRLSVIVAPALLVFYRITSPFVFVIERSAGAVSRMLGLKGATLGGGHSAEELKFIIASARRHGHLESFEELSIRRILELQDFLVREIMVPRSEILSVPVDASLDDVLKLVDENHFSRIPVYENEPEHIVGIVHYKDILAMWRQRRTATAKRRSVPKFDLRLLLTKPVVVPETKPVNQLIDDFRGEHAHIAIVVDEFGSVVGLVTLEDALEQIFGEIEDEHDVHLVTTVYDSPELEIEGSVPIRDLETQYRIELPIDAGFETLAGFLLFRLGNIPAAGETVEYDNHRFTVLEMDRNRIVRVRIERSEQPANEEEEAE